MDGNETKQQTQARIQEYTSHGIRIARPRTTIPSHNKLTR